MHARYLGCIAALASFCFCAAAAAGGCQLQQMGGDLPVDMHGLVPLVWTKINGAKARFVLDTGAFYSMMYRDAAVQYQLPITHALGGSYYISGVGGSENAHIATVKSFEFLGATASDSKFLVIDQSLGSESVGLLGQNILRIGDVEFDLANGIVRFFRPIGCARRALAYWAVNTPYSSIELQPQDIVRTHLISTARINGHRITVAFDTGAPRSFLTLDAAERAGIRPDSPGVKYVGLTGGIGPGSNKTWTAPVATFQLGGEQVEHTQLLIQDLEARQPIGVVSYSSLPDMILGADFFLSHRIYVAYSQRRIYFTYNGGPLFNLNLPQVIAGKEKLPVTLDASAHTPTTAGVQADSDVPADADGFRRRGMAEAAMQELDRALTDLTHACELSPNDAESFYDRGLVYSRDKQFKPALQDLDTAIKLQPDDMNAHLARAQLLQSTLDSDPAAATADIKTDLDAVSRSTAPTSPLHLTLEQMYDKLGDYPAALSQIDEWLDNHPLKGDQANGLNLRCWLRATSNRDLNEALDDCKHALALAWSEPAFLDSRGLVYLRLGDLQNALRDYDAALEADSSAPTSLYGRGLAELRLGETAQGQQDLAAAEKIDSGIAKRFADMGLTP